MYMPEETYTKIPTKETCELCVSAAENWPPCSNA